MTTPLRRYWPAAVLPLLLIGCGDDRPAYQPPQPAQRAAPTPVATAPPPSADPNPPPSSPDALLSGTQPPGTGPVDSDSDDPLLAEPKMPTAHSHWLRGAIVNAHVAVRLNGQPIGEFTAPIDKDITMRCRPGMNTLTLTFVPDDERASAHLDVLESEHDPPIPPLATFRTTRPTPDAKAENLTKTLRFIAR